MYRLGMPSDPSKDQPRANGALDQPSRFSTANTATSMFQILSESKQVVVQWIASTEHLGHTSEQRLGKL